jgi:hypothetical protein
LFGTKQAKPAILCAPNLPATEHSRSSRSGSDPFVFPNDLDETTFNAEAIPKTNVKRQNLAARLSTWLRDLSVYFDNCNRLGFRRHRRTNTFYSFESLEPRLCLSFEPVANAGGPYSLQAGDSLMLDGMGSTSSWDPNAPPPGTMHYSINDTAPSSVHTVTVQFQNAKILAGGTVTTGWTGGDSAGAVITISSTTTETWADSLDKALVAFTLKGKIVED